MSAGISNIKLNNGLEMPVFGLGTWQNKYSEESDIVQTVKDAINLGYRLFVCSNIYGDEKATGQAFKEKIEQKVVKRENLFIVGLLYITTFKYGPDFIKSTLLTTLRNLQTNYLDLYLLHYPTEREIKDLNLTNLNSDDNFDYVKTWNAIEIVYRKKMTNSIGLSNFKIEQIDKVLKNCTVFPQVSQVECHSSQNPLKLLEYCENKFIALMTYCFQGDFNGVGEIDYEMNSGIQEIAERYQKAPSQILLKYNLQLGNVVTTRAVEKNRLLENLQIFDFHLALEDMNFLNLLCFRKRLDTFKI